MSLMLFLQGLGSVGFFASRAFLPAFVTALLLRFGPHAPWLAHYGLLAQVRSVPAWFTSDAALTVLGVLAVLELVAQRFPEAKVFLDEIYDYLKTGMAMLTYLGVLDVTGQPAFGQVIKQAGLLNSLPALAVGAGVFLAGRVRGAVLGPLAESDEDDDLGWQGLLRWVEDVWGGFGPVALILFPMLAVAALGTAVLLLFLIERWLGAPGEKGKVPCVNCGRLIHASAPACRFCNNPAKEPKGLDFLGRSKDTPAEIDSLRYGLVAVKRCPHCADRFHRRAVKQTCGSCGHRLMDDPRFARDYISAIDRRVPLVCVVCFLFGLIPVVGVIPGVIYYRLAVVAPLRRYIPRGRGFLLRWGVRLAVVVLVAFQWVPVAGGIAVPTMALINYAAYRTAYRKLALAT